MTEAILTARVKSLETQLAVLKAQMGTPPAPSASSTLADLRGVFKCQAESGEADIYAAKYRFSWDDDSEPSSMK